MRKEDCETLLFECKELLVQIQYQHQREFDLRKKEITSPKLKSFLEHSRSILEYCAGDVFDYILPEASKLSKLQSKNKYVYFPYGNNRVSFGNSMKRNLPGLQSTHAAYKLIEGIQDYNRPSQKFLSYLCDLTNTNKHDRLSSLMRNASTTLMIPGISAEGVNGLVLRGNTYNGVDMGEVIINDEEYTVNINPSFFSRTVLFEEGAFVFKDSQTDILQFLDVVYASIEKFIHKFYLLLEHKTDPK